MANVEDEKTPGRGAAGTLEREERRERSPRAEHGGMKVRPREDGDQIDHAEYAKLPDVYDTSSGNTAEREVVTGTVLKVTALKSVICPSIIPIAEFLEKAADHRRNRRASSTCCRRRGRPSSSRAKSRG